MEEKDFEEWAPLDANIDFSLPWATQAQKANMKQTKRRRHPGNSHCT